MDIWEVAHSAPMHAAFHTMPAACHVLMPGQRFPKMWPSSPAMVELPRLLLRCSTLSAFACPSQPRILPARQSCKSNRLSFRGQKQHLHARRPQKSNASMRSPLCKCSCRHSLKAPLPLRKLSSPSRLNRPRLRLLQQNLPLFHWSHGDKQCRTRKRGYPFFATGCRLVGDWYIFGYYFLSFPGSPC
ncbi:hypothetical protein BCR44DRAFT_213247 [Catenaria anguillulae PL171]|uniref:Uncharacterized protein n=1 Tax=Catenaria anguillulae PL171 TaxID=765915 RepID=A0A1Y2HIJ1_9FUNG|nr:hypothetical protein BCR44DRAFT_213247 [Catenaria anguillulae PL171]